MSHKLLRRVPDSLVQQQQASVPIRTVLSWSKARNSTVVVFTARQPNADPSVEAKASVRVLLEQDGTLPFPNIFNQALFVLVNLARKRALPTVPITRAAPVVAQASQTEGLVLYDLPPNP